ncbi:MAG: Re/Si-specific NAD(P)(+) transhydrogenase subunit alpha [Thaumarchaeota archaeon]|nr:Re/Si-specific NAD(P)(+) transhydrogenase subunit alpha [Nitrososphaerota archaeon]
MPKETALGERRVALVPETLAKLKGISILVQRGAGEASGFEDSDYAEMGASVVDDPKELHQRADVILKVQPPTPAEVDLFRDASHLISFLYPLSNLETVRKLAEHHVTSFAMDLMPRISRAQSMDALSSQSTIAGYKAVIIAAGSLPRLFPLLMTAAGTVAPARVLVIGAGVAGLQAIAVARRLGALVSAYDVRPAAKEQVASLGAKFVEIPVEAEDAQDKSGYAKAQSEEFYQKQQKFLADRAHESDVIITTALVPGGRAPVLISEEAVEGMRRGSVIVDLAAEQGGNCALTEAGKVVVKHGVTIHGPLNLPSTVAPQASQFYSRNISAFLSTMLKDGSLKVDLNDELVRGTLVTDKGEIVNQSVLAALQGRGS